MALYWLLVGCAGKAEVIIFESDKYGLVNELLNCKSMEEIKNGIIHSFGHKLRIRVCGICIENDKVLLVKHHSIGETGILWAPPGGGLHFGESVEEALKREFLEETGLAIDIDHFLCVHEFLDVPLHAIELFFLVRKIAGTLALGHDPELAADKQIITELNWLDIDTLKILPPASKHAILHKLQHIGELSSKNGFIHQKK